MGGWPRGSLEEEHARRKSKSAPAGEPDVCAEQSEQGGVVTKGMGAERGTDPDWIGAWSI